MSKESIENAVEALTFTIDGVRYPPPLLEDSDASSIIDSVAKVLGAAASVSVLKAEGHLKEAGVQLDDSANYLYAENVLLRSLQHALIVAQHLMESGPEAKPSKRKAATA